MAVYQRDKALVVMKADQQIFRRIPNNFPADANKKLMPARGAPNKIQFQLPFILYHLIFVRIWHHRPILIESKTQIWVSHDSMQGTGVAKVLQSQLFAFCIDKKKH